MVTHSSILTWRIPRTEEPGGLQSMESQRVRHDLATKPPPPGGGHDDSLQYPCLENLMDRGAWRATVHGVTESDYD